MTRAQDSIVRVLKSAAGIGTWAGGVYGLLVGSWCPWVLGAGTAPAVVSNPLQAFVLGCLAGIATGAVTGAIVGAVMGLGIYDLLKHEQDAREVDHLFKKESTMYRRQAAILAGANGFGDHRRQVERSRRALERDR